MLFNVNVRFSEGIFESDEHTYEMEYEEPKDDGQRVQVLVIICVLI